MTSAGSNTKILKLLDRNMEPCCCALRVENEFIEEAL